MYLFRCTLYRPDGRYWEVYVKVDANTLLQAATMLNHISGGCLMLGFRLIASMSCQHYPGEILPKFLPVWDIYLDKAEWTYPEGYDHKGAFERFLRGE